MKGRPLPHPLPERRGEIIRAERGILPSSLPKRGEKPHPLPLSKGRGVFCTSTLQPLQPLPYPLKPPPTSPNSLSPNPSPKGKGEASPLTPQAPSYLPQKGEVFY